MSWKEVCLHNPADHQVIILYLNRKKKKTKNAFVEKEVVPNYEIVVLQKSLSCFNSSHI
jgi:hypothetical protein